MSATETAPLLSGQSYPATRMARPLSVDYDNSDPIRQLRVSVLNTRNKRDPYGCRREIIWTLLFILLYCLIYGISFTVPFLIATPADHVLIISTLHAIQFVIVVLQYARASYWAGVLQENGFLYFPGELSLSRKAGLFVYAFLASILSVCLAWLKRSCTSQPCALHLSETEMVEIYLGADCLIVTVVYLAYLARVVVFARTGLLPDVMQAHQDELACLQIQNPAGVPTASGNNPTPTRAAADSGSTELHICAGEPGATVATGASGGMEEVGESQAVLIRYLRHRNQVLSQRLLDTARKLQRAELAGAGAGETPVV